MSQKDYLFDPNSKAMNRLDYRPSEYLIPETELHFDLDDTATIVRSKMKITRNPILQNAGGPLILQGEDMKLISVKINGTDIDRQDYVVTDNELIIKRPPTEDFTLEIQNEINPEANTRLEGLYKSGGLLTTQCEAQGFRRITYFLDRPDILSSFKITLEGDKEKYPILISNGNGDINKTEDLGNGRHRTHWVNPHPTPSYLFALVGGDLNVLEDTFTTMSGKEVKLRILVEDGYENQIQWAMEALKKSMKWDEDVYGREYDLDVFHIVAVKGFNSGAMENKGLNIFNISILAGAPEFTTDNRLIFIEAVVAHEYFHNYSGNRVTVRDWFELTLKEGLTVLRDRQFTADMHSEAVKNIEDAYAMEAVQFIEDSGPSSHPIRPDFVQEFDNIYTQTVYAKGSHVLGMMKTLLGDKVWRAAMDEYFDRFDGQAVTCDDFIDVMQDVSGFDLSQFRKWYSQSGTPEIDFNGSYDANAKTYTLTLRQDTPPTADQKEKEALYMPISVGLIGKNKTKDLPLKLKGDDKPSENTKVLHLKEAEQTFVFENITEDVVPSILRGFSAPVKVVANVPEDDLIFRMAHDSDGYNKYAATKTLMKRTLLKMADEITAGATPKVDAKILKAYEHILKTALERDKSTTAMLLSLPTIGELVEEKTRTGKADPLSLDKAIDLARQDILKAYADHFDFLYDTTRAPANEPYQVIPEQVGRRALHNRVLGYLGESKDTAVIQKAKQQYDQSENMTERLAALSVLARIESAETEMAFNHFYDTYKNDQNIIDNWLSLKASTPHKNAMQNIKSLLDHEAFDMKVPNKVRAVFLGFMGNAPHFHATDGSGYEFMADQIIALNSINPRIGAGLMKPFLQWNKYTAPHAEQMKKQIERILKTPDLAMGIKEFAQKALAVEDKTTQKVQQAQSKPSAKTG